MAGGEGVECINLRHVYTRCGQTNEVHISSFRRLRVVSWNGLGRGHLEVAERLCPCCSVQTKLLVLESCPLMQHDSVNAFNSYSQFTERDDQFITEETVYKILPCFS